MLLARSLGNNIPKFVDLQIVECLTNRDVKGFAIFTGLVQVAGVGEAICKH